MKLLLGFRPWRQLDVICVQQRIGYDGAISVEHEPETFDPTNDLRAMREQLEEWLR